MPVDNRLRLALVIVLLGVYLLAYMPVPDSIDGTAMLAVSANLLRHGRADIPQTGALSEVVGSFGPDGAFYAKKGVTPSLALLPLVALADALPGLPVRAAAMLLNPLVTALTGAVVYSLARRIGARPMASFLTGLIFGLATLALPYTKTLFGEPLAELLLAGAVWAAWVYRDGPQRITDGQRQKASQALDLTPRVSPLHRVERGRQAQLARGEVGPQSSPASFDGSLRLHHLILAGAALGLALGINLTYAVMIPIVGLYLFGADPRRWRIGPIATFAAPVLVALGLLGLYNWARFGGPLATGYATGQDEGFTSGLLAGVIGLLVGPYRGLAWYSPVLLLAIPGGLRLRRRDGRLAGLILALTAAQVVSYATWWSWHGGVTWGPRFMLPVVPLLAVALAPLVEAALNRNRLIGAALIGLTLLSVGVQLLGVLFSYLPYTGYLMTHYPAAPGDSLITGLADAVYFDPGLSPIVGHLALLAAGARFDPAWLADGVDGIHLLAALAVIGAGGALLLWRGRRARVAALLVTVAALLFIPARQGDDAQSQAARALAGAAGDADSLLVASDRFGSALLEIQGPRVTGQRAPSTNDDPLAAGLWQSALADAQRGGGLIGLVTWFPPASAENWPEGRLWESAALVREAAAAEHRVLVFDLTPGPEADRVGGWTFGPLRLAAYGLAVDPGGVRLRLDWEAAEPPDAALTWFVHLLDANGQIVAQQDRAPLGGYQPTDTWTPGAIVTDRLSFPLAASTDTTGWAVRIGVVDPAVREPFTVVDAEGQPLAEPFVVIPLEG